MSIRFTCHECSNLLTVPDQHAGKSARCPSCQAISPVPIESASLSNDLKSLPANVGAEKQVDNPFAKPVSPQAGSGVGYAAPMGYAGGFQEPHRGGLILALGIMSLFCNAMLIPGILAWVLGSSDLKKMKTGVMDPSGHGTTQAGMIIGIIATCLVVLAILFYIVMIIFVIGIGVAAGP